MVRVFLQVWAIFLVFGLSGLHLAAAAPKEEPLPAFIEDLETGSLVVWSDLTIPQEKTYRSIVVMRGKLELAGETENLVVISGSVHLLKTARITHQMFFLGGKVVQEPGASVGSPQAPSVGVFEKLKGWWEQQKEKWKWSDAEKEDESWMGSPLHWTSKWSPGWLTWQIVYYAVFLVLLCALLIALVLAPGVASRASSQLIEHPILSFFVGFLLWFLWFPILLLLILSVVGILFVPFYLLFSLIVVVAGFLTSAVSLGRALLKNSQSVIGPAVIGFIILFAVSMVPVIGQGVFALATLVGSGAVIAPRFYRL